ncbi:hypothetical protein EYF80_031043 [Liparis tanakae]|uniref:Uncharacterized protein n=1 Tax=Liparis tanakae TaxID=230148 RepID=A0A4Z2GYN2_9TELE|nr:hypothetical protein EYF80_031043 [Liparis tanakae]
MEFPRPPAREDLLRRLEFIRKPLGDRKLISQRHPWTPSRMVKVISISDAALSCGVHRDMPDVVAGVKE